MEKANTEYKNEQKIDDWIPIAITAGIGAVTAAVAGVVGYFIGEQEGRKQEAKKFIQTYDCPVDIKEYLDSLINSNSWEQLLHDIGAKLRTADYIQHSGALILLCSIFDVFIQRFALSLELELKLSSGPKKLSQIINDLNGRATKKGLPFDAEKAKSLALIRNDLVHGNFLKYTLEERFTFHHDVTSYIKVHLPGMLTS